MRGRGQEERRGHGAPLASRRDAATGGDADAQAPLRQTEVEVHRLLEHVLVEVEAELSGAQGAELPEHDVLGETVHAVALRERRRLQKNVHGFLEGAPHERSSLHAVDAVPGDGHEVSPIGHHLDEDGEVAVVDVRAVKLNHAAKLLEQRVSHSLDAQHLDHLDEVVGRGAGKVDILVVHNLQEVDALGVEHPLALLGKRLGDRVQAHHVRLADEHLLDVGDTPQRQVGEHLRLELLEEDLVLGGGRAGFLVSHLVVQQANSEDELLRVVVVEYAGQILLEVLVDALGDVRHQQFLVHHHLAVQLDAEQPRGHPAGIHVLIRHLVIGPDKLLVLLDDGIRGIGVIPNLGGGRDGVQGGVLEDRLDVLGHRPVPGEILAQRDGERRRLDLLGDVDELLQTGHTERDVLRRDTREVEGVQRHLRRGLADGLRGDCADAVARGRERNLKPRLNLADDPVERRGGEPELAHHPLGAERRSHQRKEEDRGVSLRLDRERVAAGDDHETVEHGLDALDDVHSL